MLTNEPYCKVLPELLSMRHSVTDERAGNVCCTYFKQWE